MVVLRLRRGLRLLGLLGLLVVLRLGLRLRLELGLGLLGHSPLLLLLLGLLGLGVVLLLRLGLRSLALTSPGELLRLLLRLTRALVWRQ